MSDQALKVHHLHGRNPHRFLLALGAALLPLEARPARSSRRRIAATSGRGNRVRRGTCASEPQADRGDRRCGDGACGCPPRPRPERRVLSGPLNLVILWLVVRAAALAFAASRSGDPLRSWFVLAAATDFLLAVLLLSGLPIALVVAGLFGPTSEVIATFAWILALSFVATGALLIASASADEKAAIRS